MAHRIRCAVPASYGTEYTAWLQVNNTHTVKVGSGNNWIETTISFDQALARNGLHGEAARCDPNPNKHATINLSTPELRDSKSWYTLHWRPGGGSIVLPRPTSEVSKTAGKEKNPRANKTGNSNGLHGTASNCGPNPKKHATMNLSTPELRANNSWYTLHWRPGGGSKVLARPISEAVQNAKKDSKKAKKERRKERDKIKKRKNDDQDPGTSGVWSLSGHEQCLAPLETMYKINKVIYSKQSSSDIARSDLPMNASGHNPGDLDTPQ